MFFELFASCFSKKSKLPFFCQKIADIFLFLNKIVFGFAIFRNFYNCLILLTFTPVV